MSDIFLSYATADGSLARVLQGRLERDGWSVWRDAASIRTGEFFEQEILKNLGVAKLVVVIWSKTSSESDWVLAEAGVALARKCLVPIKHGAVNPPTRFKQIALDFTGWNGDPAFGSYRRLRKTIIEKLGQTEEVIDEPTPLISQDRFSVLVSRLNDDTDNQVQRAIARELIKYEGIDALSLKEVMLTQGENLRVDLENAESKARFWLENTKAAVMVWGSVTRAGHNAISDLYLTIRQGGERHALEYATAKTMHLPKLFWSELSKVLLLAVAIYHSDYFAQEGAFLADSLEPLVLKIENLLEDRAKGWTRAAVGQTRVYLGDALMVIGYQKGNEDALYRAIIAYRKALGEMSSSKQLSSEIARTHNGLGICQWQLGTRTEEPEFLNGAVLAYQSALALRAREHNSRDWAQTHNDLGNVLVEIGRREAGTNQLEKAMVAYQTALQERTREAWPLDWAQTTNNLGLAFWHLGQKSGDRQVLDDALDRIRNALTVYTREKTPLDWAQTQSNLGLVLWTIGRQERNVNKLKAALVTWRNALREAKRRQVPLLWATVQNNLGLAYWEIGNQTNITKRFEQAIRAFNRALLERSYSRGPMDWAQTQSNLGNVFWSLGKRASSSANLTDAVECYRNALRVYSREHTVTEWAHAQVRLGLALTELGAAEKHVVRLKEAQRLLAMALKVYDRKKQPILWGNTQYAHGCALYVEGVVAKSVVLLTKAISEFAKAKSILEMMKDTERVKECEQSIKAAQLQIENIK